MRSFSTENTKSHYKQAAAEGLARPKLRISLKLVPVLNKSSANCFQLSAKKRQWREKGRSIQVLLCLFVQASLDSRSKHFYASLRELYMAPVTKFCLLLKYYLWIRLDFNFDCSFAEWLRSSPCVSCWPLGVKASQDDEGNSTLARNG